MTTIMLDLNKNKINYTFKRENDFGFTSVYDGFKINRTKGKRVYLFAMKNNIKHNTFFKNMRFEDGDVVISFGKDKIKIGEYTEE